MKTSVLSSGRTSAPTTLTTRDIEAQVRPLMLAIMKYTLSLGAAVYKDAPERPFDPTPEDVDFENNWGRVFRLVQPPMLKVLRHVFRIAKTEDQDDMFQEVMLRLHRYHLSYDSDRPLLPWLYAIARNVKRDWNAKYPSRLKVQWPAEPQASDNTTLKLTAEDVLAKLPEQDRYILWLSYYEGLSAVELSEYLNIPLTTTKYYLRRAKKLARDLLTASAPRGRKQ